jgi:hypothetical protein
MFLKQSTRCTDQRPLLSSTVYLALALIFTGIGGCSQDVPPCLLELPVYDAAGDRLNMSIVSVTREDDRSVDFLKATRDVRMKAMRDVLRFPEKLATGLRIEVTLSDEHRRRTVARIPLLHCEQRASLRHGQSDTGADVTISSAEAYIVGCKIDGNWWVRTMPMFGAPDYTSSALQGYIRARDGFVRIDFPMGERLIVVLGRGKELVKSFAVNVTAGRNNVLGPIDVTGSCPK